jgi:hypothetical protein
VQAPTLTTCYTNPLHPTLSGITHCKVTIKVTSPQTTTSFAADTHNPGLT